MTLGSIHKQVSVMLNIKLSSGGGCHVTFGTWQKVAVFTVKSYCCYIALLLVLLATGILNSLPGLTSCRCNNIGLVSLILLGWELCVLYHCIM